jgi:hypothetical protein
MASLLNLQTDEVVNLLALHIFGRHPTSSNTVLNNPKASRVHATITWDGEFWSMQDNSTNGTFINGTRAHQNANLVLKVEDRVQFAGLDGEKWTVKDVEPPKSMLIPQTAGTPIIVLQDIAVLPNEETPLITLYQAPGGLWVCESSTGTSILTNGDRIGFPGNVWCFNEATSCLETMRIDTQNTATAADITVSFKVSKNQAQVSLQLNIDNQCFNLGDKNHHQLLLLLARQRIADINSGLSQGQQGWLEKSNLAKLLKSNETQVNIQVYLLRKQVIQALPHDLIVPQMFEIHHEAIRLVYENVQIETDATLTSSADKSKNIAL